MRTSWRARSSTKEVRRDGDGAEDPDRGDRMTEHDRDQRKVRITDKRRVRHPDERGEPLESEVTDDEARGSSEGTPLVTEEDPSASNAGSTSDAEARAAEYLDDLRRLKAEFENYRKRVLKEQTRAVEMASEPIMAKLLEVLDEFELALMAAERTPDFERFVRGVEMVYAKLTDVLRSEGLERLDADGKPFDPSRHEALLQTEGDHEGDPYVGDVLRTGYTLKGRVLRPAGVKVVRR
jgi:molecular chaperone GrpE